MARSIVQPFVPVSYDRAGAVAASAVSDRELYDAIADGELVVHYRGTKQLILHDDLKAWVESLPTKSPREQREARGAR